MLHLLIELVFSIIKKIIKKGFGVAVDADCAGTGVVETLEELVEKENLKLFLVHINTPEKFILENIKRFRSNSQFFLEAYHRRKPLHKKLDYSFSCVFDLSRGDVDGQVLECEKKLIRELER